MLTTLYCVRHLHPDFFHSRRSGRRECEAGDRWQHRAGDGDAKSERSLFRGVAVGGDTGSIVAETLADTAHPVASVLPLTQETG